MNMNVQKSENDSNLLKGNSQKFDVCSSTFNEKVISSASIASA
jgi:hypothetical protein